MHRQLESPNIYYQDEPVRKEVGRSGRTKMVNRLIDPKLAPEQHNRRKQIWTGNQAMSVFDSGPPHTRFFTYEVHLYGAGGPISRTGKENLASVHLVGQELIRTSTGRFRITVFCAL